jgi:LysM repeat protein
MSTARNRLTGLLASAALLGIVLGLPAVLLSLESPLPDQLRSLHAVVSAFTSPDDGTLALTALKVVAWAVWLVLTGSILVEIATRIRGIQAPAVPGFRLPQSAAKNLVSAAAMLFVAAPILIHGTQAADAQPAPRPTHTTSAPAQLAAADRAKTDNSRATDADGSKRATLRHTVQTGESLWSIAAHYLGSGSRYPEIAALNRGLLGGRPGFLKPGMVLTLPAPPRIGVAKPAHRVKVHPGDTLSAIAEAELGDADRYPEIFEASRSITQPHGVHLSDPDIIDIGWTLAIPGDNRKPHHGKRTKPGHTDRPTKTQAREHTPEGGQPTTASTPVISTPSPTSSASTKAPTANAPTPHQHDTTNQDDVAALSSWVLTGLTSGGVILAGSILMLLRRRRRAQFRARRPGRTIAVPDTILAPVEKTVIAAGGGAAPNVDRLDTVLRRLATSHADRHHEMPRLVAVELTSRQLRLHLSGPADLTPPWAGSDDRREWAVSPAVDLDELGPDVVDQPAPYPLLVTVGTSDSDAVWLVNCEQLGIITITGDITFGRDFARYIAAELACNPWSQDAVVDCVGLASEVGPMNPERVKVRTAGEDPAAELIADAVATVDRVDDNGVDVVTARAHQAGADTWPARMLLLDAGDDNPGSLGQLLRLVGDQPGRTGICVVVAGETAEPRGVVVRVSADGRVQIPHPNLDLIAVGLTSDEARGCAALLAQSEDLADSEIPAPTHHGTGWRSYSNHAGALRADNTLPRDTRIEDVDEPVSSVLDGADSEYVQDAATTTEDLAALAPRVPVRVRSAVEGSDPGLDADIEAWFSDRCDLPRLTLLGPVWVRAHGTAIAKRKPYYTELLTYLATRPHGATPEEVADAFNITGPRARNDVKVVRDWLGVNPRTGRKHLPDAREAPAAIARGVGVYQVEGLLVDINLFRRLRVRGEARGRRRHPRPAPGAQPGHRTAVRQTPPRRLGLAERR